MSKSRSTPDEIAIDVVVGANLRRLRGIRNMSQEALGDASGISFQQIQKYEKGANRLPSSRLWRFTEILECGILDFFEGVQAESAIKPIPRLSNAALRYSRMLEAIPDGTVRRKTIVSIENILKLLGRAEARS